MFLLLTRGGGAGTSIALKSSHNGGAGTSIALKK
jgi:hypothetical protein